MNALKNLAPDDDLDVDPGIPIPPGSDDGWRPYRPPNPCGRTCCRERWQWPEEPEPPRTVDPTEYTSSEVVANLQAFLDHGEAVTSAHEVGHCLASIVTGCEVILLQQGPPQPFCQHTQPALIGDEMLILLAGDVAGDLAEGKTPALPPRETLSRYLTLARKDEHGPCDNCRCAANLRKIGAEVEDGELAAWWEIYHTRCVKFFSHEDVRKNLELLAAELREQRVMDSAAIAALVDAEALKAAYASIKSE
jgi:hypothetical protein